MKTTIYLIISILLMSCSVEEMQQQTTTLQNPYWIYGCFISEYGSADGTDRTICFDKDWGFLDITFTNPDGTWVAPYQPIYYDFSNPVNFSNYKESGNIITFDYVDEYHPEIVLKVTLSKVITDDGSLKIDLKYFDGSVTYHCGKFIPVE